MKKRIIILLALCLLLCACQKQDGAPESADKLPTVISQAEYVEYQNLFFNKQADAFVGQHVTKTGTLVLLEDNWANVTRYYVWGYYDQTKCCDWQWEFVPKDPADLPPAGSLVEMTGTLEHDEAALDYANLDAEMLGVNNRHLGTFITDVAQSFRLAARLPQDRVLVSESGISSLETILRLRQAGFRGFLIGEHFMRAEDPGKALEQLIEGIPLFSENKYTKRDK